MIKVFNVVVPFLFMLICCSYFICLLRPAIAGFDVTSCWIFLPFKSQCLPHITECLLYLTLPFLDLFTPINMPSLSFDIVPHSFAKACLAFILHFKLVNMSIHER